MENIAGVGWVQIAQDRPCQEKEFRFGQEEMESHRLSSPASGMKQMAKYSLTRNQVKEGDCGRHNEAVATFLARRSWVDKEGHLITD